MIKNSYLKIRLRTVLQVVIRLFQLYLATEGSQPVLFAGLWLQVEQRGGLKYCQCLPGLGLNCRDHDQGQAPQIADRSSDRRSNYSNFFLPEAVLLARQRIELSERVSGLFRLRNPCNPRAPKPKTVQKVGLFFGDSPR